MSENNKFLLVGAGTESPFGGYVSATDRTTISRRFMVKGSKNMYLKKSGTLANRPGLLRRGSADSTNAGVLASTEWETSLGYTRPLRLVNGKLQVEYNLTWYDILTTAQTRVIFDLWWDNTAKKDILLFCDGTASMKYWNGGIGVIASTTANTIVLTAAVATQGFNTTAGTVIVNGTEYAYTGSSVSTLTGVTPDPTGEAAASIVLEKPVTDSNTIDAAYLIDFIKVVNNQLYAGSDSSRLVYISKNTDWDDFTKSSPRATGEGDILTLDEIPTGIGERSGQAHIGSKKAWYEISFEQITIGTSLSEQTKVKKVPMAPQKGPLRHEFIGSAGNDMVYLSQDQQLHVYGTFTNITEPQFPSLSDDIEDEFINEDFRGGHLRVVGDMIYITAPNSGRVWLHETMTKVNIAGNIEKERIWHSPFIWNLSRIAVIDGVEYGHSNAQPQIYQLWNTLQWHDDSPSDESIPYDSLAVFGYRTGNRYDLLEFDKVYYEGYMTPGSDLRNAIAYEYKGERATQEGNINYEATSPEFYIGDIGTALGDTALGDNPLGDRTSEEEAEQELVPKFRIITKFDLINCHEYQVRVYGSEPDTRFELIAFGANEVIAEEQPVYLER